MLPVRPERHLRPMTSVSDTSSSVDRVSVFAGRALMDELVNRKDFCIFILMYLIDIMKIIYI
ncbi:hypothetical protein OkiPb00201_45400 [Escherichia coli]